MPRYAGSAPVTLSPQRCRHAVILALRRHVTMGPHRRPGSRSITPPIAAAGATKHASVCAGRRENGDCSGKSLIDLSRRQAIEKEIHFICTSNFVWLCAVPNQMTEHNKEGV